MAKPLLLPTAENLRVEMARHRIRRESIADLIGMNPNLISMYINNSRRLSAWAAHNLGYAINRLLGKRIFDVNMDLGVVPSAQPQRRDPRTSVVLPVPPAARRFRRRVDR